MDESDYESKSEEEIPELADLCSSSSYCPSSDDSYSSDSDLSLKSSKRTPRRGKLSVCNSDTKSLADSDFFSEGARSVDNRSVSTSISGYESDPCIEEHTFQDTIKMYLEEFKRCTASNNPKIEYQEFIKKLTKQYTRQFTKEKIRKLKTLVIMMEDINENNGALRKYYFSYEDIETIKQNWNSFCEDYGFDPRIDWKMFLPPVPFFTSLKRIQRDMFKHYMAQNLPYHGRHKVFDKFFEIYHCSARSHLKFTPEEDELLATWRLLSQRCLPVIAFTLKRPIDFLKQRVRFLFKDPNYKGKLKRRAKNEAQPALDILSLPMDEYPEWTRNEEAWAIMAVNSGQYSVKTLKKTYFFEIYPTVRLKKNPLDSTTIKKLLIEWFSELKGISWETVDWRVVGGHKQRNIGAVKAYTVMRKLTKKYVPKEQWHDLEAAVEILRIKFEIPQVAKKRRKRNPALETGITCVSDVNIRSKDRPITRVNRRSDGHPDCSKSLDFAESPTFDKNEDYTESSEVVPSSPQKTTPKPRKIDKDRCKRMLIRRGQSSTKSVQGGDSVRPLDCSGSSENEVNTASSEDEPNSPHKTTPKPGKLDHDTYQRMLRNSLSSKSVLSESSDDSVSE